jgi:hypothetical protein
MINLQQTRGIFRLSDNFGLPVCPLDHVGEPGGAEQCSAVNTKPGFSPGWSKVVCYFSTLTLAAIPERL